jgi:hypothetical protein
MKQKLRLDAIFAAIFSLLFVVSLPSQNAPTVVYDSVYLPKNYVEIKHPEWSKNATIYEVNIRQYTPEGTFKHLKTTCHV